MTMIEENSFICPIDAESFTDSIVISTNQMGQHSDLKPVVAGVFPFPFFIHACPSCGFAGYDEDFHKDYPEDFKEWVKEELAGDFESGELFGGRKYFLAARCAVRLGRESREIADLYLKGAWCASEEESPELEEKCRRGAAEHYIESLESGECFREERAPFSYLVGELYRRVGEKEKSDKWFDKVAGEIINPEQQKWLFKLAVLQKSNPVDIIPEDLIQ